MKGASYLRPANAFAVVVEQLRIMPARLERFDEAARLPIGAVVDALMKCEDSDFHRRNNRRSDTVVPKFDADYRSL